MQMQLFCHSETIAPMQIFNVPYHVEQIDMTNSKICFDSKETPGITLGNHFMGI